MLRANEQYAYFAVSGDFDPGEITARVGVEPTRCWRRGDICPQTHRERQFSRWSLYSRLDQSCELEAHIRDVLTQLEMNPQAFRSVAHDNKGVMQLVSYFHRDYPGLHFDRDITVGLGRYSLAVDFDFYWLYPARRENTDS